MDAGGGPTVIITGSGRRPAKRQVFLFAGLFLTVQTAMSMILVGCCF